MDSEGAKNTIRDWDAQGMLNKASILERLDNKIQASYAVRDEEKPALKSAFESACNEKGLLTETGFISLLQQRASLPQSLAAVKAGKILYSSLVYLSTLPFPRRPDSSASSPVGLSLAELTRALVWAVPDRYKSIIEEGNFSRLRTKADHRRLLFQSLATIAHDEPHIPESARQLALRNAFDVDSEGDREFCSLNHDDDGDELYHDLLDTLYSTQEEKKPWMAPVSRDAFRPVAKRIATENEIPSLHTLGIRSELFVDLAKLLLALQFNPAEINIDLDQYDDAARSVCAGFGDKTAAAAVITWPAFDRGLRDVTQYLFEPFYHMLLVTYMGHTGPSPFLTGLDPPASTGSVLTLPRSSQLATFLAGSVYFGALRRVKAHSDLRSLSPLEFVTAMKQVPDEAIVLLSGRTETGETCVWGVFSPKPSADGDSVQTNVIPNHVGLEPCALFQLAPVHDVFRGTIGKPGWTADSEAVVFGQDSGVVLGLKDGLRRLEITHQVPRGDESKVFYKASEWRGDWTASYEVLDIEIWSEKELK